MGPAESIAAFGFFGMLIAIVIVLGTAFNRYLAHKERKLELIAAGTAEKAAQYASHVERLEARVRVLERIATDKGSDLAQQIDDLRTDAPALAEERA